MCLACGGGVGHAVGLRQWFLGGRCAFFKRNFRLGFGDFTDGRPTITDTEEPSHPHTRGARTGRPRPCVCVCLFGRQGACERRKRKRKSLPKPNLNRILVTLPQRKKKKGKKTLHPPPITPHPSHTTPALIFFLFSPRFAFGVLSFLFGVGGSRASSRRGCPPRQHHPTPTPSFQYHFVSLMIVNPLD